MIELIPALDLINGQCVRLHQGDFSKQTDYDGSALERAQAYADQGAKFLHLVDLDGARSGNLANIQILEDIASNTDLAIQWGGGIRSEADVQRLLNAGASRVVLGSFAYQQMETVQSWLELFGKQKICIAMDVRLDADAVPRIATKAWESTESTSLWQYLSDYSAAGLKYCLCTDIGRDGDLSGPNVGLYREIRERDQNVYQIASGGVSSVDDLIQLNDIGANAVVIGKALLDGRFQLEEAYRCLANAS